MKPARPLGNAQIDRLEKVLSQIKLPSEQKAMLVERYLQYARWLDRAAKRAQNSHYVLRVAALIGGVLLPAIAGIDISEKQPALRWTTLVLGAIVGLSVALDGFLNLRERWLHFREATETVQSKLWQFASLSGERFAGKPTHEQAFPVLVIEFEHYIQTEVASYLKGPAREAATAASTHQG